MLNLAKTERLESIGLRRVVRIQPLRGIALLSLLIGVSMPVMAETQVAPVWQPRLHFVGDLWTYLLPSGVIGNGPNRCEGGTCNVLPMRPRDLDLLRIDWIPSLEYPGGSRLNYLYVAAPMFGGIRGTDTLVSTSFFVWYGFPNEFNSFSEISESSSNPGTPAYDPGAIGEQEYFAVFSDTATTALPLYFSTLDEIERRPHRPLGVEVRQTSRAWSSGNARTFVIFDLWFKNISGTTIADPCIGLNILPTALHYSSPQTVGQSRTLGFIETAPADPDGKAIDVDTLMLAWASHISGLPEAGAFTQYSPTSAIGFRLLRTPRGRVSFNWWGGYDEEDGAEGTWGPRRLNSANSYAVRRAWPLGDRSLYQLMTNGEVDYDAVYAAVDLTHQGWAPPSQDAFKSYALASGDGLHTMHVSCGPLEDLLPGDSLPLTFAIVGCLDFHTKPENFAQNFNAVNPQHYREGLDFSTLIQNARVADWFFDNPGVDTDNDGYHGKFYLTECTGPDENGCDTVWFKGDGVPDWGGESAPPSPSLILSSQPHQITLRWTGEVSETSRDKLSRRRDFEGYRLYSSRVNSADRYALIASWDIPDNYYRIAYIPAAGQWRQISYPLTTAQWRLELHDDTFSPDDYDKPSIQFAYRDTISDTARDHTGEIIGISVRERLSYWAKQGPNHGNTYADGDMIAENVIRQIDVRDTIIGDEILQFGVYEAVIANLNAAIPLWFTVTTFDHGDYRRRIEPMEGRAGASAQFAFPQYSADVASDSGLSVTVYPNPYKIQFQNASGQTTNYFAQGFEAYGEPQMTEHDRRIWFANLPDTATIRIYSLDGDLIREIHHPDKFLTRYSSIVGWDLISRNTQAVVSGIYIWRVDSRLGSQVGKLVIIK